MAPANWTSTVVDSSDNNYPAFVVGQDGRVHAFWFGRWRDTLFYGTCAGWCSAPAAWRRQAIAAAPSPAWVAAAIDDGGALHVAFSTSLTAMFRYAVCGSFCLSPSGWRSTDLPWQGSGFVRAAGIAVDGRRGVHIGYRDWGATSRYLSCPLACTGSGAWHGTLTDTTLRRVGHALRVTPSGRPRLPYYDLNGGDLVLGVCDSTPCGEVANWRSLYVDTAGNVGLFSSIVLDSVGRPIVAYHDNDRQELRVAFPF